MAVCGAVIRDSLPPLADRFPRHVLVGPVRVPGEGAAAEVAAAIEGYWENRMNIAERIVTLAVGAALMWPAPHWVNFTALAGFAVVFGWNIAKGQRAKLA